MLYYNSNHTEHSVFMKKILKKLKKFKWPFITVFALTLTFSILFIGYNNLPWDDILSFSFYENLANPSVRVVKIREGARKEEIAEQLATTLGWNNIRKNEFLNARVNTNLSNLEGYYFPTTYLINKNDSPASITQTMIDTFETKTKSVKKTKSTKIINEETALKVASIIQREAAGKSDMRLISGIIWNRIFKGMKLQIDATLQYAKGDEENWWPQVESEDKNIKSPYNTYLYPDLPPTPISNPGLAAIEAAYNPQPTSCLFYIHDRNKQIHCSSTYQGHLNNINRYY